MDYGFAFLSAVDIYKDVALAERKGFSHAWLYDTQMICADVFQCLALGVFRPWGVSGVVSLTDSVTSTCHTAVTVSSLFFAIPVAPSAGFP